MSGTNCWAGLAQRPLTPAATAVSLAFWWLAQPCWATSFLLVQVKLHRTRWESFAQSRRACQVFEVICRARCKELVRVTLPAAAVGSLGLQLQVFISLVANHSQGVTLPLLP